MVEVGIINRELARVLSQQGHMDKLMVADAGFAIPKDVEVVDLSLAENKPMVLDVLAELRKFCSVEKMIMAHEMLKSNPTLFDAISKVWGDGMEVELIEHSELKNIAKEVKAVIRTGDFTAYGNVILVSGAGDRWHYERKL